MEGGFDREHALTMRVSNASGSGGARAGAIGGGKKRGIGTSRAVCAARAREPRVYLIVPATYTPRFRVTQSAAWVVLSAQELVVLVHRSWFESVFQVG